MSIRILKCASMSPWFPHWHLAAPCLLVETEQGLVLVDTGLGIHDYQSPSRMVRFFNLDFGTKNNPEQTVLRQIIKLGYKPDDLRHIVLTHLHFDHAGGLPDFPHAQVHLHRREYEAMLHHQGFMQLAYDRLDFAHEPQWVLHEQPTDTWEGFDAIRLPFTPEMYFIPLFGHTRGHCGVAVQDGDGWLFLGADALPTNVQFDILPNWIYRLVIGPHVPRLRAWAEAHPDVRILAGHMWESFFD
jgi:glyoxylase-like metal-dependent hydrolase (beta-lactamase superfamily II)